MTTITIPVLDVAGRPTRLEALLLAASASVQRGVATRMMRRAEQALAQSAADEHAERTRVDVAAHLARHPRA
ncbi:hypothetical protein [Microbacterium oleivorans]|uniref:hypothetical protein n=1 Tax=Microbacterium oleivorans TaxID=273677 RepID=UPI00203B66D9|nr:hypothetical protein [Microbacterium oleivorans]MCM3696513.1 hypothetical protein [Microbacterium oleivorans]